MAMYGVQESGELVPVEVGRDHRIQRSARRELDLDVFRESVQEPLRELLSRTKDAPADVLDYQVEPLSGTASIGASNVPFAGKPLHFEVIGVYTGRYPRRRQRTDMLVTSASRNQSMRVAAAPKLLNWLVTEVGEREVHDAPDPTVPGSGTLLYDPKVTRGEYTFQIGLSFDDVDVSAYQQFASVLKSVAPLALLGEAGKALYLAGEGLALIGEVRRSLFDRVEDVWFQETVRTQQLDVLLNGRDATSAFFVVDTDKSGSGRTANDLRVEFVGNELRLLQRSSGARYQGNDPMLVLRWSHDISPPEGWEGVLAAGELVQRFISSKESPEWTESVVKAFQTLNDYELNTRARAIQEKQKAQNLSAGEKALLQDEIDQLNARIRDGFFKV